MEEKEGHIYCCHCTGQENTLGADHRNLGTLGMGCKWWIQLSDFANGKNSQQMKLVDFYELVIEKKQDDDKFWDWLDSELADTRELYEAEDAATRARSINL